MTNDETNDEIQPDDIHTVLLESVLGLLSICDNLCDAIESAGYEKHNHIAAVRKELASVEITLARLASESA